MTAVAGNYLRKIMKLDQDVSKKPVRGRIFESNLVAFIEVSFKFHLSKTPTVNICLQHQITMHNLRRLNILYAFVLFLFEEISFNS